jgi:hypothetical protein
MNLSICELQFGAFGGIRTGFTPARFSTSRNSALNEASRSISRYRFPTRNPSTSSVRFRATCFIHSVPGLRPSALPRMASFRRCSSVSRSRLPLSCSTSTWFSARRYSIASCWLRLIPSGQGQQHELPRLQHSRHVRLLHRPVVDDPISGRDAVKRWHRARFRRDWTSSPSTPTCRRRSNFRTGRVQQTARGHNVLVVTGDPGVGKSALVLQAVDHLASAGAAGAPGSRRRIKMRLLPLWSLLRVDSVLAQPALLAHARN